MHSVAGQIIKVLRSERSEFSRTAVMLPQAGDACWGFNYIRILRRALDNAGFPQVPLLSLNMRGIDRKSGLRITISMVRRALAATIYRDILMLLQNQVEPYETQADSVQKLREKWIIEMQDLLLCDQALSARAMRSRCKAIASSFRAILTTPRKVQKVGIVGELYMKYCHLGNWNLERYLHQQYCQVCVNGLSWYVLYYMDTHLHKGPVWQRLAYRLIEKYVEFVQAGMVSAIRQAGFSCSLPFSPFQKVPLCCGTGNGWLISAEVLN